MTPPADDAGSPSPLALGALLLAIAAFGTADLVLDRPARWLSPHTLIELGFVALSQLAGVEGGSRWEVPADLYTPIRQDAVLLEKGAGNEAATAFFTFLKSGTATAIIEKYGYAIDAQ